MRSSTSSPGTNVIPNQFGTRSRLLLLVAVAAFTLLSEATGWALPVARLRRLQGQVEVRGGASQRWVAGRERNPLEFGDFVRTGAQGKADILFTNGTQVALRANSAVEIVRLAEPTKPLTVRLWGAIAEVFVRPKGDTQIQTAAAIAAARGTEYLVRNLSETVTEVIVTEGVVESSNQFGMVLINAGQRSTASTTAAPSPPIAVDVSGLLTWTADIGGLPLEIERPFLSAEPAALKSALATREAAVTANMGDGRAHLEFGQALHDVGRYAEASGEFQAAARLLPNDAGAQRGLARALLGQGNTTGALKALGAARALDGANPINNAEEALAQLAAGDEAKAQALLAAGPATALGQTAAGVLALRHGRTDEAIAALQSAQNSDPQFYQAGAMLALAYLNSNNLDRAETAARAAVRLQPASAQTQGALGLVLFFRGQTRPASQAADRAVSIDPFSPLGHLTVGRIALAQQRNDNARSSLEQARALAPGLLPVHIDLGNTYLRLNMPQKAEHEFRTALQQNPNSSAAHTGLGNALKLSGRRAEAEQEFQAALKLNKDDTGALGSLAQLYLEQGKIREAQELIGALTGDRPEQGALLIRLAEASLLRQDLSNAQEYARGAVKLLPASAVAHYQLGRVFLEQGRLVQAEQEFRQAVTLDPQFAEARYALGFVQEQAETGFNPARPLARVGAYNLGSTSGALDIQNLQTPGASERVKAALLDPSVTRLASSAYGNTQLEGALGSNGTNDFSLGHLETSSDRIWTLGASAGRQETDGPIANSDTSTDRYGVVVGQRFPESRSSLLFLANYSVTDSGGNTKNDPADLTLRELTRQPHFIAGANFQTSDRSRTRMLLQVLQPTQAGSGLAFGGSYHQELDSLNGEIRHDIQFGHHLISFGGGAGTRTQDIDLLNGPIPPFAPASRFLINQEARLYDVYVRDEWQASKRLRLTGELDWHRSKLASTTTFLVPVPFPPLTGTLESKTRLLPTVIAAYNLSPRSALRLRARRLAGGIRDFQLLFPSDVFLFNYDDLARPALVGGRGSSYELEYDRSFNNASFLRVGVLHQGLTNVRTPSINGSGAALQKVDNQSLRIGYEGMLTRSTSFFMNTTFNSSEDKVNNVRVPLTAKFSTEAGLHFLNRAGWFMQPSIFYQGSQIDTDPARTPLGGYTISNLRVGKRWGLRRVVFAEVINAFDKDYTAFDIIQPGRQFRVGATQRF